MLYKSLISLSLASVAIAHGDHGHGQEPMSGPHEGLWYNTLPGDGGTQVSTINPTVVAIKLIGLGRLCLLRYQHLRPSSIPAMLEGEQHQV